MDRDPAPGEPGGPPRFGGPWYRVGEFWQTDPPCDGFLQAIQEEELWEDVLEILSGALVRDFMDKRKVEPIPPEHID